MKRKIVTSKKSPEEIIAKTCYDHLGGKLGDMLFERLIKLKWFKRKRGARSVYEITPKGQRELAKLGVDVAKIKKQK